MTREGCLRCWRAYSRGMELWIDGVMDGWGKSEVVRVTMKSGFRLTFKCVLLDVPSA
jgi:hypothetical protein